MAGPVRVPITARVTMPLFSSTRTATMSRRSASPKDEENQMASIHKEMHVDASPDHVWAAFRDIGAIHTRLARGFVTDTKLERDSRLVTFVNGIVAREQIIDIDDGKRRLAYSVVEGRPKHHHATFQVC